MRESELLIMIKKSRTILTSTALSLSVLLVACSTSDVEKGSPASPQTIPMMGEASSYTSSRPVGATGTEKQSEAEESDNLFAISTSTTKPSREEGEGIESGSSYTASFSEIGTTQQKSSIATSVLPEDPYGKNRDKTNFTDGYTKVNPLDFTAYESGLYAFNYSFDNKIYGYCFIGKGSVNCTGEPEESAPDLDSLTPFNRPNSLALHSDNTWEFAYLEGWSPQKELKTGESITVSGFTCIKSEEDLTCKNHVRDKGTLLHIQGPDRRLSLVMV